MTHYLNERLIVTRLKNSLFQNYDGRITKSDLESMFYLIDLLVKLEKQHIDDLSKLMNIILTHKTECGVDYCKCNSINDYRTEKLLVDLNLILESIFVNLNLGKESVVNILFAEYLYFQRKSTLFAWSIMNTYISKNTGIVKNVEIYQFFLILLKKVNEFDDVLRETDNYVHFNLVFTEIAIAKFYEKKMVKFMDNFENFVDFKEKFDNSLKVDHNEAKIDSYIFQTQLSHLVNTCRNYQVLYRKMKTYIRKDFGQVRCKSVELGYKLFSFFTIFNKKVPTKLLSMICMDSTLDVTSHIAVQKYFNYSFQKFFTDTKASLNMIIEINKIFKIKYINHKLCHALGHSYNKLINDDIHQLFPTQLREPHKKVLLNHFLIQKKLFFKKKTFAFTASHNMLPLELMVSTFPNLKKNLQAVVSIYPSERDNSRNFFFVITEFYELIAISDNLDEYYSINYDMIDILGINVLKLFDIENIIALKFKGQLDRIKKERADKHMDHLYSLSSFLFNLGGDEERPPQNQQHAPQGSGGGAKKESGTMLFGGGKGAANSKDKHKGNQKGTQIGTQVGTQIYSKMGTVSGNMGDHLDSDRKDNLVNTVTPGGVMNNLGDLSNGPNTDNGKGPYSNYQGGNQDTHKNGDKSTPNGTPGEHHAESGGIVGGTGEASYDEIISVLRDKKGIIQNLDKIKNRCKDMEIGIQFYERLCESVDKLKKSCGPGYNDMFDTSKPNSIKDKIKNKYQPKTNTSFSENFQIKISFRKINDAPFFIIGVKEKMIYKSEKAPPKKNMRKDLTVIGETPDEMNRMETQQTVGFEEPKSRGPIKLKNKLNKNKTELTPGNNLQSATTTVRKETSQQDAANLIKEEAAKKQLEKQKKEQDLLNDPSGILSVEKKKKFSQLETAPQSQAKKNKEEERQMKEKNKEFIITAILGVLLFLNLAIAVVVFDFKLYVLNTTKDFFTVVYWSKEHESSLLGLHSALISFMMMLDNLTTFRTNFLNNQGVTVPLLIIKEVIEERSNMHRDNFANFFTAAKASRYKLDSLESLLYTELDPYDSLIITWDPVTTKDTFTTAVDYICSNSKSLAMEEELEGLASDLENGFLFRKFDKLKNIKTSSKHSKLLYFINQNILKFEERILKFNEAITTSESDFIGSWRKLTSIMEIINIVLSLVLIFVIHYTLSRFDRSLFKILLSMFINMRKGKKANFKATFECQLIKLRMRNFKTTLFTFNIENIRGLDETLNIDEIGVNKLLVKNNMRFDALAFAGLLGELSADTSALSKDPLLNATLGGSLLGLNSSQTPLAASSTNTAKEGLGLNNEVEGESDPSKEKKKTEEKPKDEKKSSSTAKRKKVQDNDEEQVESFITNGQIMKRTKHYSIQFVKFAKVLITIIFLIYIIFIVSNVVTNTMYLNNIDSNMALVSSFVMKFPAATRIYNMIRLMIIESDLSFVAKYPDYLATYSQAALDSDILYDQFSTALPKTFTYYEILNSQDYEKRSEEVCQDGITKDICTIALQKENGYNKEGLKIAAFTVMQTLNNIYKDYLKIHQSGIPSQVSALSTKETIFRYFNNEEFANVNVEMDLVLEPTTSGFFKAIYADMTELFDMVINLDLLLGISSICLNITIILYLIFGFFSRLNQSMNYISYSANKFNRALFEA
jgi:hypothetical protein